MKEFEFLLTTRIVFGNGAVKKIGEEARKLGSRSLIVTDKALLRTGFVHADEAETSSGLLLFPEMVKMEYAVDTGPMSEFNYLPDGH